MDRAVVIIVQLLSVNEGILVLCFKLRLRLIVDLARLRILDMRLVSFFFTIIVFFSLFISLYIYI